MEYPKPQPIPEQSLKAGYELRDTRIPVILWFGLGLTGVVILVFLTIGLLYNFLDAQRIEQSAPALPFLQESKGLPPQPRLQRNPANAMEQMRTETEAILNNYGWVDKQAGVVRIPIERAIDLTLERGLTTQIPEQK